MVNITVGRYTSQQTREFWQGWIEPDDKSWIMFVKADGSPVVFLERNPDSGAVIARDAYVPTPGWTEPDAEDGKINAVLGE
jgi:hypothetical protein